MSVRNVSPSIYYGNIDAQNWSSVSINKTPKLNFAHPWAKLNFRLLIRSCCNASFLHHAQVTTKHSILNWISWSNFAHPFYLNFHGAFGLLLVLGGWDIERFIKHHLPHSLLKITSGGFQKFSKNKNKFLGWHSHSLKGVLSLPRPFCVPSFSYF